MPAAHVGGRAAGPSLPRLSSDANSTPNFPSLSDAWQVVAGASLTSAGAVVDGGTTSALRTPSALSVATSVFPHISFPVESALQRDKPTVEINTDPTRIGAMMRCRLAAGAAIALDAIWERYRERRVVG